MSQITSGVRSVLGHPAVYSAFQRLMGADAGWHRLARDYIQARPGEAMLDVGCGPADVLGYLPEGVRYHGFDISPAYIERARARHGDRGTFACRLLRREDLAALPPFDVVLASGLLHHLDDDEARQLVDLAFAALKPGGRLVTVDPCLVPGQHPVARFLIDRDRGRNVRGAEAYRALAASRFGSVHATVRHQAWIPYTHCYLRCVKEGS